MTNPSEPSATVREPAVAYGPAASRPPAKLAPAVEKDLRAEFDACLAQFEEMGLPTGPARTAWSGLVARVQEFAQASGRPDLALFANEDGSLVLVLKAKDERAVFRAVNGVVRPYAEA